MHRKVTVAIIAIFVIASTAVLVYLLRDNVIDVLDPKGVIAAQQRDLMIIATLLMLTVVIPVFILTFAIAWKYRAGNVRSKYRPDWDHDRRLETIWWGVPLLIIAILSGIIFKSSHELDPYRPLQSEVKPVTVQVVALRWKWLFIYPEHNIASVNYLQFPVDRPVNFKITSDAPMNSFWIPRLGGQVYAMSGMETKLHLMASEQGRYDGYSANLSGEGFAKMKFVTEVTNDEKFQEWVASLKAGGGRLGADEYARLSAPSAEVHKMTYGAVEVDLYDTIIRKYTEPARGETRNNESLMPKYRH